MTSAARPVHRAPLLLGHLTVFQHMLLFACIALVSMLVVGIPPILQSNHILKSARHINENHHEANLTVQKLHILHLQHKQAMGALLYAEGANLDTVRRQIDQFDAQFQAEIDRLRTLVPEHAKLIDRVVDGQRNRQSFRNRLVDLVAGRNFSEARHLMHDKIHMANGQLVLEEPLKLLSAAIKNDTLQTNRNLDREHNAQIGFMAAAIFIGLLIFIAISMFFTRLIVVPLNLLRDRITGLVAGRLDEDIPFVKQRNEIGDMARALSVLQQAAQDERDRIWVKEQLSALTTDLQKAASLDEFCRLLLNRFCPLAGAVQALCYVDIEGNGCQQPVAVYGRSKLGR